MSTADTDHAFDDYAPAFLRTLLADPRSARSKGADHVLLARGTARFDPPQSERRNFARQTFAFVDGSIACLRMLALVAVSPKLRPTEVAALYGNVELRQQSVTRVQRQAATGQVLLLANHVLHTHLGLALIDKEGPDWTAFTRARKLRNRLAYARLPEQLEIGDEDFTLLERTLSWQEALVATAFKETAAVLGRPNLAHEVVEEMLKEA